MGDSSAVVAACGAGDQHKAQRGALAERWVKEQKQEVSPRERAAELLDHDDARNRLPPISWA